MNPDQLNALKYPVGKFARPSEFSVELVNASIRMLEQFPQLMFNEASALTPEELNWTYRPEGWSIRQVVHHVADSHMNAFIRFKLALTEETPTIKPYAQDRWAELPDVRTIHIDASLRLLEGLHQRWVGLLRSLSEQDLKKCYNHPEQKRIVPLFEVLAMYSWHCSHHLAHVQLAKKHKGSF